MSTPLEDRISALITPTVTDMGYELVRVQLQGRERPTLQVMAERADRIGMTVDDCEQISHAVSALMDVEDPVEGAYTLEVSSPGIDRPLTRPQDFDRFAGFDLRLETSVLVEGRKRMRGVLLGRNTDGAVLIRLEDGADVSVPQDAIHKAKLVLTDALIDATLAEQEAAAGLIADSVLPDSVSGDQEP